VESAGEEKAIGVCVCAQLRAEVEVLGRTLKVVRAANDVLREERDQLIAERDRALERLADRVVIDRAKGILMTRQQLSESDAYHLMRRNAMRSGQRLVAVAQEIVASAVPAPEASA
jgi:AmiR/NasT family two-component response regulator